MGTRATTTENSIGSWRNYSKRVAIKACKLHLNDLKRLYQLINEKQIEAGEQLVASYWRTEQETQEQFEARCQKTKDAFITAVKITGTNSDVVSGTNEAIFDSGLLPGQNISIEYDTFFTPKAVLQFTPATGATVFLDFSHPKTGGSLPSQPTPNNSSWFVTALKDSWSTSLSARLEQFFIERKTSVNWLHQADTYDVLLLTIGLPLTFWASYKIGHPISAKLQLMPVFQTALYVYLFFVAANVFKWLFAYGRWVFSKIELNSERSKAGKHRAIWLAIIVGIFVSALWDGLKFLLR